ncbi:hypothetical protein [Phenylobacterium sp. SCN 70-31]|uniref:hypothetical protein n=1 Tax=Phenylobacterium sp. SCN 70-31 TaxID=1660129 RepID=UPI0025E9EC97|nr:hypothetical protein [Phenylobacterium sp. SCN 70-31]
MAVNFPTISIPPDTESVLSYELRLLTNDYGDGYQSRTPDGINNLVRIYSPSFQHITYEEKNTLQAFYKQHAPVGNAFVVPVLPEDETGNTTALFIFTGSPPVFKADEGGALYNVTFSLREVFGE